MKRATRGGSGMSVAEKKNPTRQRTRTGPRDRVTPARPKATGRATKTKTKGAMMFRLRLKAGASLPFEWKQVESDALLLAYVARNRRRWSPEVDPSTTILDPIRTLLLRDNGLQRIADSGIVEVCVDPPSETPALWAWPARIMPWEFVLSTLTHPFRGGRPLTVIRCLDVPTKSPGVEVFEGVPVLLVESAPGGLRGMYDLTVETKLVRSSLGLKEGAEQFRVLPDPELPDLAVELKAFKPGIVHFAGFDNHQAADLLHDSTKKAAIEQLQRSLTDRREDPSREDGLVLARAASSSGGSDESGAGDVDYVKADRFDAAQFDKGLFAKTPPKLVSLNMYNSAARTAPWMVMSGAEHAIGFQDTMDDRLAEQFFSLLYRNLYRNPPDERGMLSPFVSTLNELRETNNKLRGVGIVLWTAHSLIDRPEPPRPVAGKAGTRAKAVAPAKDLPARDQVSVLCDPNSEMNYSLLHNSRPLFKRLQIIRGPLSADRIDDINVSVTLYVGEESFPYVRTLTMPESQNVLDLTRDVRVPLTSALMRTQSEKVRSVLSVEVKLGNDVVHRDTYPLTLAPVDQWTDTEENRLWLPSFVLPRDPAVAKIVQGAQRYLVAIQDDPAAGFDSYQSVDESEDELDPAVKYAAIDKQVKALWYAMLLEPRLTYINPPPSYANPREGPKESPQRLRTPSEIVHNAHGTCIDLALLLCSCLEYVDIWPVIFLLDEHAFPGYWRSDVLHEEFQSFGTAQAVSGGDLRGGASADALETSYTLLPSNYLEVKAAVDRGDLVPLETVWLTNYSSFEESKEEGRKNLRSKREFVSMIDLKRAREAGVAPLPMLWSRP